MTKPRQLPNGQYAISQDLLDWISQSRRDGLSDDDIRSQFARAQTTLYEPATAGSPSEGPVIPIITEVRVDWEKVLNAFIGVCETHACTYWMRSFLPNADKVSQSAVIVARENGDPWYGSLDFWGKEGRAVLTHDDRDDGETQVTTTIGESEIISGLNAMANKCPVHFADLIADNDDAITHDVLIQCILFGEIIFG